MKKIRILFYKTPWKAKLKYWVNWLISIRTLSKYSHVEVWTADAQGKFRINYTNNGKLKLLSFLGKCYTSTMRDKDNGTVARDASGVLKHPENWDYIELEVLNEIYDIVICNMEEAVRMNNGYSNWDVLKFVSPVHFPDNTKFICSEFVSWVLVWAGIILTAGIVSPGYIYKMLTKIGYKAKGLK